MISQKREEDRVSRRNEDDVIVGNSSQRIWEVLVISGTMVV